MASSGSPEAAVTSHEAAALKTSTPIPKIAAESLPSPEGNRIIQTAQADKGSLPDGLPALQISGDDSVAKTLTHAAVTEAVTGGTGAATGAAVYGALGKAVGSFAEIFMKSPAGAASISDTMAFDMAAKGAADGGVGGLVVGAVAFGAYEVLKQSYEHPDRAPDLAALI